MLPLRWRLRDLLQRWSLDEHLLGFAGTTNNLAIEKLNPFGQGSQHRTAAPPTAGGYHPY
jgi:hypothetical protein